MSNYLTHKELPIINNLIDEIGIVEGDISRQIKTNDLINILDVESEYIIDILESINNRCSVYINELDNIINDFNNFKDKLYETLTYKGIVVQKHESVYDMVSKVANINTDDFQKQLELTKTQYDIFASKNINYPPIFDTSNVTSMLNMFYECKKLTSIPLYNTKNVTSMKSAFFKCVSLESIPKLDMSKVMTFWCAFSNTNITSFLNDTTTNLKYCTEAFRNCSNLKEVIINTTNILNANLMFNFCELLESIEFINTTKNVIDCFGMFSNCLKLSNIKGLDTSNCTDMGNMFYNCQMLKEIYLDTKSVTDMSDMFNYCYNLTKIRFNPDAGNIVDFNISHCTKMTSEDLVAMFESLPTPRASRTITLGSVLLNRLTEEQKQIAIDKNYILA